MKKGYATHQQVADFLGLSADSWQQFFSNYRRGDLSRVPQDLRNMVRPRHLRFLTGFTDGQLEILLKALDVPLLLSEGIDEKHPLVEELRVLVVFGVLLVGRQDQYKSYKIRPIW